MQTHCAEWVVVILIKTEAPWFGQLYRYLTSPAKTGQAPELKFRRNVQTTVRQAMVMVLASALAASCIQKEERKEEPTPVIKALPPAPPPEPVRSALPLSPAASYTIVGAASDKCLQYVGAPAPVAARAEIRTCNGSKAQQFTLQPIPGGYQTLVNAQSNKCLDVAELSTADAAPVNLYDCNGGPNQQWIVADAGPGTIRLVARHSGKVLDVKDDKTEDGAVMIQYGWKSSPNQQFKLKAVAPQTTDASSKDGQGPKADKGKKADKADKADKAKADKSKKADKAK